MSEQTDLFSGRTLLVALDSWSDVASGATMALNFIREQLGSESVYAVEDEDYFNFIDQRPTIVLDENGDRDLVWPSLELWAEIAAKGRRIKGSREIFLLIGQEPSLKWHTLKDELIEVIEDREITSVIFVGSLADEAPHTRPIRVQQFSNNVAVRNQLGVERSNYEGPTGFMSVLAQACEENGVPYLFVWAQVPHYVSNAPSAKVALAIVNTLEGLLDVNFDHSSLSQAAFDWERNLDEMAEGDEDMANYIASLEKSHDEAVASEASGDQLAKEVEKFLRQNEMGEGEGPAQDHGSAGE